MSLAKIVNLEIGNLHLGVLKSSLKRVRVFRTDWNSEVVVFKERKTGEKPLGERERTNDNKLNLQAPTPGFEPKPHCFWWEASALTTAPLLLLKTVGQQYLEITQ